MRVSRRMLAACGCVRSWSRDRGGSGTEESRDRLRHSRRSSTARSDRPLADASPASPVSRAIRPSTTPLRPPAACGSRPMPGPPGNRCSTISRSLRWDRSPSRRRIRTSSTSDLVKRTSVATSPPATGSTSRWMREKPGRTSGNRKGRSARWPFTHTTPTSRTRQCWDGRSVPTRSAASTAPETADGPGSRSSRRMPTRVRRTSPSIPRHRPWCSRACGKRGASRGSSSAVDPAADSTSRATAATPGRR